MVLQRLPQLYDSTHLAGTEWYRGLFEHRYSHNRGLDEPAASGFPEDVLSEYMLKRAAEIGVESVVREFGSYILRQAPVPLAADGGAGGEGEAAAAAEAEPAQGRGRASRAEGVAADAIVITHIDGRRFLNMEQRSERGLPAHIPKYDPLAGS
jgi:hypothetical protein